ncbi:hypothetical protein E2C01_102765 [Portunus trituberculatus]|uniref:Uncharacterized protein n=1 Tax=Portunus trituberculatus TaxID=210409 RepID=A0A5B7KNB2_PORTR|nr:hypothetical protein [Portunus trituberculatus]
MKWRKAAGAQAGCFSGETRNQLEERRGVHQGTVCWCMSWLQNPDPIVASEREEPRPVAKPHDTGDPKLNNGRPGGV